jgi:hypothetical protein
MDEFAYLLTLDPLNSNASSERFKSLVFNSDH